LALRRRAHVLALLLRRPVVPPIQLKLRERRRSDECESSRQRHPIDDVPHSKLHCPPLDLASAFASRDLPCIEALYRPKRMVNADVSPGNINLRARFFMRGLVSGRRSFRRRAKISTLEIFRARNSARNAGIFYIHCASAFDERFMLKR
jgi:hypothetical protein